MQKVNEWLCSHTGREFSFLTGRGTTAIHVALRAFKKVRKIGERAKIAVPASVSPTVPNSVLSAGYEPIFYDANLVDFNADIASIKQVVESERDVQGIIPVHLYGYPEAMNEVTKIADESNLFVIEDVAQAMGGEYRGKRLGSFGDVSIFSFGYTKILDCGGGGAVLTDDEKLARQIETELKKIPSRPINLKHLKDQYRKVYYSLYPLVRSDDRLGVLFFPMSDIFKDMYVYKVNKAEVERIKMELSKLGDYIKKRRENAKEYRRLLKHPDIVHPKYRHWKWTPWRYSFLIKTDKQKEVTETVRSKGVRISDWYPPVHRWYASGRAQDPKLFKDSIYLGAHVINLWVDPSIPKDYVERCSKLVLEALEAADK